MKTNEDSDSDWDSIVEPVINLSDDKDGADPPKKSKNLSPLELPVKKPEKAKKYESDAVSPNRNPDDSTESSKSSVKPANVISLKPEVSTPPLSSPTNLFSQQKKHKSIFSTKSTKEPPPPAEDFPPSEAPTVEPLHLGINASRSSELSKDGGPTPTQAKEKDAKNKHQKELKENILNLSFRNEKNKEKRVQKVEEERWMYTFDHGNYDEFRVTVDEPESCVNPIANRYDHALRRCWLEIFSSLRLVTDCVVLFVIHLLRFVIRDVAQPLVVGIFVIVCDYLLKPALAVSFSSFFQPILVFVWNLLTSFAHAFRPVLDIVERLAHILAHLCRSLRLVEINYHTPQPAIQRTEHL